MKKIFVAILALATLFSCRSSKQVVQAEPEVRTVIVEKAAKNTVTDEEMDFLKMWGQGWRNFNAAPKCSSDTWEGRLQQRLTQMCNQPMFLSTQLGIVVYDVTAGKELFSFNADHRLRPASCQKLVTAISALDLLGGNYSFVPQIDQPGGGWCWDDDITSQMPYRERRTWTMTEILQPMMKDSDNKIAESLFWQLSRLAEGKFGELKSAVVNIEKTLQNAGISPGTGYRIADGSGLSLYNYITPNMLNALLIYAWSQPEIRLHLIPSLPVGGVDGTLKKRFHGTNAYNNIYAKTGTVTGVSSLAGYANGGNGHVLSFCIINQGVERGSHGRDFQDQVCIAITEP